MIRIIYTLSLMLFVFDLIGQSTALVPYGSTWKYLDNGKNQGSTWRNISFNDAAWKSGLAQLGYGDGDEATVVSFGGNANKKYITTYFRKTISIGDASGFSSYTLNIKRDDGAVVYINGTEVFRTNMPAGSVSFSTKALDATDDGNTPQSKSLGAGTLVTGTNVIAVEIHQVSATSTDISFDLELFGNTGAAPCNPPTGLNTSGITTTGSTIAWTSVSGAISYDADYKANSSSTWINAATGTTSTSLNLSGLTASTLYDWRVKTNCTSSSSTYSTSQFTTASTPSQPTVTRGPYLQMGNETAITIRWRTNIASDSRVQIGTTPASNDVTTVSDGSAVTEHEIRVTGLSSDTKYYYTIGTTTGTIQGDANNYFQTAPSANTTRKIRIAAFGDCGTNSLNHQSGTLTAYRNYLTNNALEAADAWLLLGDNAYSNGTDAEYSSNFFNPYGSNILKNHKLYPSPGNHDYAQSSSRQADHNVPYFNMFTLPANAECGGVPSGNEHYFSYDIGNVHFLSLNSYGKENGGTTRMYDTLGAQAVWVKQDLAANTKPWVIAYWHHPPYTMGSHNSDTETELINIRLNFIRILERYGVDLILCGHSHDYERSYLLNGYYGNESSFNVSTHTKSNSSGKYDGSANSCPYTPAAGGNHGTVYVLSGSSGASGGTQAGYPHNAMPWSINDGGMTYIEVEGNRLDQKFIRMDGTIWDRFTIIKDANKTTTVPSSPGAEITLTASWPSGTYIWSTGATTRSITVSPAENTTYTVSDMASGTCLTDVYNVTVGTPTRAITRSAITEEGKPYSLRVQPTVVKKGQPVRVQTNASNVTEVAVVDVSGRIIQTYRFTGNATVETKQLRAGIYFLQLIGNKKSETQKVVVVE